MLLPGPTDKSAEIGAAEAAVTKSALAPTASAYPVLTRTNLGFS